MNGVLDTWFAGEERMAISIGGLSPVIDFDWYNDRSDGEFLGSNILVPVPWHPFYVGMLSRYVMQE